MKLISLYIDNFGKLADFKYNFNDDITVLNKENGWGKTTLASFIKVMFYGFDNNKRKISENERLKYYPWNKKNFGGNLIFEINKKRYRIERHFGKKITDDEFFLYDLSTNKLSNDYTSNIGEEIFKINSESFEKSIFIPQKELNLEFNSDLKSKLASLIGDIDDIVNVENAINIIQKNYKEIKMNSKKGLLIDKENELNELEEKIKESESKIDSIKNLTEQSNLINKEITSLNESKKLELEKLKSYNEIIENNIKISNIKEKEEQLILLKQNYNLHTTKLNDTSITSLQLEEAKQLNNDLKKAEIEKQIVENKISSLNLKIKDYQKFLDFPVKDEFNQITDQINNLLVKSDKKVNFNYLFIFCGFLLLIFGIIFVFYDLIVGIISSILGIISFLIGLIKLVLNKKTNNEQKEIKIREFFAKYQIFSSDFTINLKNLKNEYYIFNNLNNDLKENNEKLSSLNENISTIDNYLKNFFAKLNLQKETYDDKLTEISLLLNQIEEKRNEIISKENQISLEKKNLISQDIDDNVTISHDEIQNKINFFDLKINEKIKELSNVKAAILICEEEHGKLLELEDKKTILIDDILKMKQKYSLLVKTEEFILNAQESIKQKYVKPMQNNIDKYVKLLLNVDNKFTIDIDFNIMGIENGNSKDIGYYSKGYQQLVSLCLRLALIDCLYVDVKPFIILDDPFVNFDNEKLISVKNLLKEISKNNQIIYFTCHDSRKM